MFGVKRRWFWRKECSGGSFATVLTKPLPVPEHKLQIINSVKLACCVLCYKSHTFILSVQANVLFKRCFCKESFSEKQGIAFLGWEKGQLKRVLNARNGMWIFFFFLYKIIPNVFFPTTDKAYSNHCLKKMNERLPKISNMEKKKILPSRKKRFWLWLKVPLLTDCSSRCNF